MTRISLLPLLFVCALLSGCGYNDLAAKDEAVKSAWGEVTNQYKRRADLVPNLVRTVQGFAKQERDVLIGVTEARAKVGQMNITPQTINDPAALTKFTQAQDQLSGALSKLMVVVEKYPDLKSDQNFRELQAQLEGTENRVTVARQRFIESVKDFNVVVRSFPTNLTAKMFGYQTKPTFTVSNEAAISDAPTVKF